jgi:hypothetical protein
VLIGGVMPTVAVVDGVKIQFYPRDHPPPHFHAEFAEYRAIFDIRSLSMVAGSLPEAKRRSVIAWASTRKEVLLATFAKAISKQRLDQLP